MCFTFLYGVLHIEIQIYLLKYYLENISENFEFLNDFEKIHNSFYQKEIEKKMCFCVQHHANLLRFLRRVFIFDNFIKNFRIADKLINVTKFGLPVYVFLTLLCSTSILFFILNVS